MRVSIASPHVRPSPNDRRVGIRIRTFEACSGFTFVTAHRIAQQPKAAFVAGLRPSQLPGRAACQLPDQSTIIRVRPSLTDSSRPRGARSIASFGGRQITSGLPHVTIGAVGADRWQVEIFGRASHAGVAPERGISSTMILALALADVKAGGWFGKVVKGKRQGTSNVGPVTGGDGRPAGDATNVVTDYVHVRGESRSHDAKFFKEITKAYKTAFEKAAKRVKNSQGKSGRVKFKAETDYYPFRMKESLPVVKRAVAAVSAIGGTPAVRAANGGLDANWMVRHGVSTVTFGAGQNEPHTIDEWVNLDEYDRACVLAVQLATMR